MDFEYESAYRADSPLSYDVEEGELSSGSGRSSTGTVRDNASTCSTQTDDRITTMRVEIDGDTNDQQTQTSLQPTPKEIAQMIKEKVTHKRLTSKNNNQEAFSNRTPNNPNEQGTSTHVHSYQHTRPSNNGNKNIQTVYQPNTEFQSPPLPNYPPPVRPPPPTDRVYERTIYNNQQFTSNKSFIRPHNLRFPYAITPRSNNYKSFFHQSTNEQSPTATVMETIWFQDNDPRLLTNPHSSNYNPLLSYRNWSNMPFDSRDYCFIMAPLHNLKDRISEYFPPLPSENTNTVKRSTKTWDEINYIKHATQYLNNSIVLQNDFCTTMIMSSNCQPYAHLTFSLQRHPKTFPLTAFLTIKFSSLVLTFYIQRLKMYRTITTEFTRLNLFITSFTTHFYETKIRTQQKVIFILTTNLRHHTS